MDIYAHVTEKQRDQVAEKFANDINFRLGHGDIKTNMDIYAHVTEKQRDQVAEKFANDINF